MYHHSREELPLHIPAELLTATATPAELYRAIGIAEAAFQADRWDGFPSEGRGRIDIALAHRLVVIDSLESADGV